MKNTSREQLIEKYFPGVKELQLKNLLRDVLVPKSSSEPYITNIIIRIIHILEQK